MPRQARCLHQTLAKSAVVWEAMDDELSAAIGTGPFAEPVATGEIDREWRLPADSFPEDWEDPWLQGDWLTDNQRLPIPTGLP
jgi:hypothetical protein